ncbi:hypothetical protein NAT51_17530 [Flavobacterium amniphilum]|uniref:hypothetical protein n=1 Tax=Flavobacterium amniphilum TaxID=1834035 RepID=UPI002029C1F8|nr:hypothetical protein [Flavobacterium amniphilum]MCL9807333.1 hypothetical protein [Flavobacterium amniphilum]
MAKITNPAKPIPHLIPASESKTINRKNKTNANPISSNKHWQVSIKWLFSSQPEADLTPYFICR